MMPLSYTALQGTVLLHRRGLLGGWVAETPKLAGGNNPAALSFTCSARDESELSIHEDEGHGSQIPLYYPQGRQRA